MSGMLKNIEKHLIKIAYAHPERRKAILGFIKSGRFTVPPSTHTPPPHQRAFSHSPTRTEAAGDSHKGLKENTVEPTVGGKSGWRVKKDGVIHYFYDNEWGNHKEAQEHARLFAEGKLTAGHESGHVTKESNENGNMKVTHKFTRHNDDGSTSQHEVVSMHQGEGSLQGASGDPISRQHWEKNENTGSMSLSRQDSFTQGAHSKTEHFNKKNERTVTVESNKRNHHGIPVVQKTFHDENGRPSQVSEHYSTSPDAHSPSKGGLSGKRTTFHSGTDQEHITEHHLQDRLDGPRTVHDKQGNKVVEENYEGGLLKGKRTQWETNPKTGKRFIKTQENYQRPGVRVGPQRYFNADGSYEIHNYSNTKGTEDSNPKISKFDSRGSEITNLDNTDKRLKPQPKLANITENGLREGIWGQRHSNGVLGYLGRYKAGYEVGTHKYWDSQGNLLSQIEFSKGTPKKIK